MSDEEQFASPEVRVDCPFCYQTFWTTIDWSAGDHQTLDLDCEVCCHALVLKVSWDPEAREAQSSTEKAF